MPFPKSRSASKQKQGTYVRHADLINDKPERSVEDGIRNVQRNVPEVSSSDVLAVKWALYFADAQLIAKAELARQAREQKPAVEKPKAEAKKS